MPRRRLMRRHVASSRYVPMPRSGCLGALLGGTEARVETALESTLRVALAATVMPVIVPTVVAVVTSAALTTIVHPTTAVLGCIAVLAVVMPARTETGAELAAERRTEIGPEARAESAATPDSGLEAVPSVAAESGHLLVFVPAQLAGDGLE